MILAGAACRFYHLGAQSLWVDEVMSVQAAGWPGHLSLAQVLENYHGPLHAVVLALWAHFGGWSESSVRLPSVVASILTLPVVFALTRSLYAASTERGAAVAALAIAAFSPFAVWYAQECRNYAFVMLFASLCLWAAWRLVAEAGGARGGARVRWWILLACSGWAAVLSNLDAMFLLAGLGLAALALRPSVVREPAAWGALVAILIGAAPWTPAVVHWLDVGRLAGAADAPRLRGATTLPAMAVPFAFYAYCTGYSLGPSLRDLHVSTAWPTVRPWMWAIGPAVLGFGLAGATGVVTLLGRRGRLAFIAIAGVVPLLCVLFLASRNMKVFNPRYVAVIVPLVWVVLGAGLARLPRGVAWMCGGLMLAASALSLVHGATDARYAKDDFRAVGARLAADAQPGDAAIVEVYHLPLLYYGTGAAAKTVLYEAVERDSVRLTQTVAPVLQRTSRIWRIFPPYAFQDPAHVLEPSLARWGRRVRTLAYTGVTVEEWERAPQVVGR